MAASQLGLGARSEDEFVAEVNRRLQERRGSSRQAAQTLLSFLSGKFLLGSDPWLVPCEFDRLLTKSVPHIFEKIFFSLDYESFKNCRNVCQAWKELFASKRYCKREKQILQDERHLLSGEANAAEVKRLLMRGVSPNVKDRRGMTPLIAAAKKGNKDMVQMLLDRGAEPNMIDKHGKTPLIVAVRHSHKDVAKLLLNRGADPNAGKHRRTTLSWAVIRNDIETVQQCLDGGADPNMMDTYDEEPVLGIALFFSHDVVNLLLDRGADINDNIVNVADRSRYKRILRLYHRRRRSGSPCPCISCLYNR